MSGTKTVSFEAKAKPKAVKKKIEAIADSALPEEVTMPVGRNGVGVEEVDLRDPVAPDEQFPTASLARKDPGDVLLAEKLALQEEGKDGITPFGQLIAKDSDFELLAKKREQEAKANFQHWFANNYDRMSPAQKKVAREIFPSFYAERLNAADQKIELQRKLVHLKIHGVRTKDDLLLQYASEAGYIDTDGIDNILHPERAASVQEKKKAQDRYARGLFNPRRLVRGDWGTQTRDTNAQFLTGRPETDASKLGTGEYGFSAVGHTDSNSERTGLWRQQYQQMGQFLQ